MNSTKQILFFSTIALCGLIGGGVIVRAAEARKPKYTVKEVMKEIHKGEDNIGKRVAKGAASKEDVDKMIEYYQSLPLNDPPRGEKASWHEKTSALFLAAQSVREKKSGALESYKAASNCKACHSAHKPEDKK